MVLNYISEERPIKNLLPAFFTDGLKTEILLQINGGGSIESFQTKCIIIHAENQSFHTVPQDMASQVHQKLFLNNHELRLQ